MNVGIGAQCERYHNMRLLSAKELVLVKIFGGFLAGFRVGGANILGKLAGGKKWARRHAPRSRAGRRNEETHCRESSLEDWGSSYSLLVL